MNSRGLLCFLIMLAFAAAEISALGAASKGREKWGKAKAASLEAEELHAIRTALEISMDKAIEGELQAALLENASPEEARERVNRKITELCSEMEKAYRERATILFSVGGNALSQDALNENSKASIFRAGEQGIAAEYYFTGGLLASNSLQAEIQGEKAKLLFRLPPGYTARAVVI